MPLPNFLIIGAGKAGTTSLYAYLKQHPQVYMSPIKEPNFFAWAPSNPGELVWGERPEREFPVTDLESYRALFDDVTDQTALGEASVVYLDSLVAPMRIRETLDDVRLIASLRDPAGRAYSSYWMGVRQGREKRSFAEVVDVQDNVIQGGFYYRLLKRYFDLFDRNRIEVILFDDLKSDPLGTLRRLWRFLEVDEGFTPDVAGRHNPGGVPRNRLLDSLLSARGVRARVKPLVPAGLRRGIARFRDRNLQPAPPMPVELRRRLEQLYREDIRLLQKLLQRDLSSWFRETAAVKPTS